MQLIRFLIIVFLLLQTSQVFSQGQGSTRSPNFYIEKSYLYVPDIGDPITLWKKSDLKFSLNLHRNKDRLSSFSNNSPKEITQFKMGFSPLPNIYLTASFANYNGIGFVPFEGRLGTVRYDEKMRLADFGIGRYYSRSGPLISRLSIFKKQRNWMMEKSWQVNGLIGISRGRMLHQKTSAVGEGVFDFNRFYGQAGFHFQRSIWGISTHLKFGMLNYYKTSILGDGVTELSLFVDLLMEKNNFFFMESSSKIYMGTRFGQVYYSLVYARSDAAFNEYMLNNYKSVGIVLDIQEIFKKKNKDEE